MLTIKKILCPVDFSAPSLEGLDVSVDLAGCFGSSIEAIYVLPILPPQPIDPNYSFQVPEYEILLRQDAEKRLVALLKEKIPETIVSSSVVVQGSAGKEIVKYAE